MEKNKKHKIKFVEFYINANLNINKRVGNDHQNLGDQIYEIVKNKIIYHEFKPGDRIIDKHLAEELGVSRSLVRQVLTILEKEELVTLIPRTGFYVKEITRRDVEEIYDIRKLLETYATELAVPRLSNEDIARVSKVFEEARKDLEKDKVEKFIEADARLHEMLINNCGNERLKKMVNKYNNQYIFYRVIDLSRVERAKESYFEHYKIFKAVKTKKAELAAELMAQHIENAKNIILDNFNSYTFG